MILFLIFIFAIPFILEGIGVGHIHFSIFYGYFLFPSLLFLISLFRKKRLFFPKKATYILGLFILFSLASSFFFSVNTEKSFESTLFYLSSFLIFIFFYNFKKEGKWVVSFLTLLGSFVFIAVYLLFRFNINLFPFLIEPSNGYQMVISYTGSHNHLGDFLGLAIILVTYLATSKNRKILGIINIFFTFFFLLSFSRSSYTALLLTGVYYFLLLKKWTSIRKLTKLILVLGSLFIVIFSFIIVKESTSIPFLRPLNIFIQKQFQLGNKDIFAERDKIFSQSIQLAKKRPIFGYGPGNYGLAITLIPAINFTPTETAHNIFLEILVENGLPVLIIFLFFIFLVIKSCISSNSVYALLFIYLLMNFQTDYTYNIYSVFIFFMILAGIIYKEKKEIEANFLFGIGSLILHLIFILIFARNLFLRTGNIKLSTSIYPLNGHRHEIEF